MSGRSVHLFPSFFCFILAENSTFRKLLKEIIGDKSRLIFKRKIDLNFAGLGISRQFKKNQLLLYNDLCFHLVSNLTLSMCWALSCSVLGN